MADDLSEAPMTWGDVRPGWVLVARHPQMGQIETMFVIRTWPINNSAVYFNVAALHCLNDDPPRLIDFAVSFRTSVEESG